MKLYLPAASARPGLLRKHLDYDRFATELESALDEPVAIVECPIGQIDTNELALAHWIGRNERTPELDPLVMRKLLLLGVSRNQVIGSTENSTAAGLIDEHAMATWRQRKPLGTDLTGVALPEAYLGQRAKNYANNSLVELIADFIRWHHKSLT